MSNTRTKTGRWHKKRTNRSLHATEGDECCRVSRGYIQLTSALGTIPTRILLPRGLVSIHPVLTIPEECWMKESSIRNKEK